MFFEDLIAKDGKEKNKEQSPPNTRNEVSVRSRTSRKRVNEDLFGFDQLDLDPSLTKRIKTVEEKKLEEEVEKKKAPKIRNEPTSREHKAIIDSMFKTRRKLTHRDVYSQVQYNQDESNVWRSANLSSIIKVDKTARDENRSHQMASQTRDCVMKVVSHDKSVFDNLIICDDTLSKRKKFVKKHAYKTQSTQVLKFTSMGITDVNYFMSNFK